MCIRDSPNIVFPSGAIIKKLSKLDGSLGGETLYIYYGATDTTTCVAHVNLIDLISTMRPETSSEWHFKRFAKNPIIEPKKEHSWEMKATFNPAVLRIADTTHILY